MFHKALAAILIVLSVCGGAYAQTGGAGSVPESAQPAPKASSAQSEVAGEPATHLSSDVSANWWGEVQKDLAAREYFASWQDKTPLPELEGAYQAPNRAQNLRAYFTAAGPRMIRRTEAEPTWTWGLELVGISGAAVGAPEIAANGNRVEYQRGDIAEWYVNSEKGLEQGFTISDSAGFAGFSVLNIDLAVRGDLTPSLRPDGQTIEFLSAGGVGLIQYGHLKASDALGRELDASMDVLGTDKVRLIVDIAGAVFPVTIDPLASAGAWTAESNQASADFGFSVSTAGDVNNDGYADVIVGAPYYDNGETNEGGAFVYHGSASGLSATPNWTAEGNQAEAQFGYSVSTAGSVNGFNYAAVIIGAPDYDNGETDEGRAFVYYGSASGLSATPVWTAEGNQAGARFGYSVSTARNVNGGLYDDIIIGAPGYHNGETNEGRAFVYEGGLFGLSTTPDWTVEGNQAGAFFGSRVSTAGDVNGDGYADVIVGAPAYHNGEPGEGRAYVYHGSASGVSTTASWTADGGRASASFGSSVSTAGDVNGDGYADVIVGAPAYSNGESGEGRAFVYLGSASGLGATANWTAESDQAGAQFGTSVSTAGDVNNDGYADVIVGAYTYDNVELNEGRVSVYCGSALGLRSTPFWTAESNQAGANFGISVSTAGDVNGDGYADVIVGAPYYDNGQTDEGRAFVYYGGPGPASNWSAESDQASANMGSSGATAGDVNGDGYADVIVGAPYYDNGETDEGRVLVYHGSASGLSTTPYWTAESNQAGARFGSSVSTAGDIDGDGYADVIVGAPYYDNGETDEGRAYVYRGSATGLLATAWAAESNQASAYFGTSVSTAGDVSGDGYADVIIGAPYYDNGQTDEGRAFVWHGSSTGLVPNGTPANANWSAESNQANARFGTSVSTAGDVNGDGYADVIVGAPYYDNGQTNEGWAYVYHGSGSGLSTTANWTAECNQMSSYFGTSVSTAGDVNGDGYADIIVGAYNYDNSPACEGWVFVWYGSSAGLGANGTSANADWIAEGGQANAYFGYSVSTAGDVNGDGYADIVVGAYAYDNGQTDEGRAYLYRGSASGLSTAPSWIAENDQAGSNFATSVSTAGDVNGDGYADIIVGAPYYDDGQADEGVAFVYYGAPSGLAPTANWTAEINRSNSLFGLSVSTADDVNGDGYADVIVGAPYYDDGQPDQGMAVVYFGAPSGLTTPANWMAVSNQAGARFGSRVSTAGDVNGDGYADVIVGAPNYDNGESGEGRAFVWYGSSTGLGANGTPANADWSAESDQIGAFFGTSVSTAGDVNGDGYADVIVGAPNYDNGVSGEGRAFVWYGSATGLVANGTPANANWAGESEQVGAYFGSSVSTAGDVNGDGFADVIVGAYQYDAGASDEGWAFVWYGSATGLGASGTPANADWSAGSNQLSAYFGASVSTAGDVNGDRYADVIVGAPNYDHGEINEGRAFVWYGSSTGLGAHGTPANADWSAESNQANACLGRSVSTAGDVNGDGYADVIVGAPNYANGETNEGRASVYYGSASGLSATLNWTAESNQASANMGASVAAAGDVNGDGYADVIVGAPYYDNGETDEGLAFVYYGNGEAGRGLSLNPRQRRSNDSGPIAHLGQSDSKTAARLAALGRSPFGRAKVKLECEVKPLGTAFNGAGTVKTASWTDTGTAGVQLNELLSSLTGGTVYHWRVRLLYNPSTTPYQQRSRWFTMPWNGGTEADFRTLPLPPTAPTNPGATNITASQIRWTWTDNSPNETGFKVWADPGAGPPTTLRTTTAAGVQLWDYLSLGTNVQHAFQVAGTNLGGDGSPTTNFTAWTAIEPVSALAFSDLTTNAIGVASTNTPSNLASGTSGLYFVNTTAGTNSGWQQNTTPWASTGLSANTQYAFSGQSRNGESITTTAVTASKYTLIEACEDLVFTPGLNAISVASSNTPSNLASGSSGLYFANTTAGTNSGWQQSNLPWASTGLSVNTQYAFSGQSRNGDATATTAVTASNYTLIEACEGLSFNASPNAISVASTNTPSNLASGTSGLYFANTTAGTNSDWQQNNTPWPSTGLLANTQYTFSGQSRNGDSTTTTSVTASKYTLIEAVETLMFSNLGLDAISVSSANVLSNLTAGSSGVSFVNTTAGTVSGWQQNNTPWPSTGLLPNSPYTFSSQSRNAVSDITPGATATRYTLIEPVAGLVFSGVGENAISVASSNVPSNLAGGLSGVIFANTTTSADSGWQQSNAPWPSTGLSPNTAYAFSGQSRNGDAATTTAATASKYTLIEPVTTLSFSDVGLDAISVAAVNTPSNLTGGTSGLYFANTTAGTNSGWQQNSTPWASTGLSVNTQYAFSGQSRNGESAATAAATASRYTQIEDVAGLAFSSVTTTSISVASSNTPSHITSGTSGLYFANTTAGTDSGWQQSNTAWASESLSPNIEYSFSGKSRNGDSVETTPLAATKYTLAATPVAPTLGAASEHSFPVAIGFGDGNPNGTVYAIQVSPAVSGNSWAQANGTLGSSPVYQTATAWGIKTVSGLAGHTTYSFTVTAQNGEGVDTSPGPAAEGITVDTTPPTPVISGDSTLTNSIRTLTVSFGEHVVGFSLPGGVNVQHGTASNLQSTETPGTYTVDILGSGTNTVSVSIPAGTATDDVGNPSDASAPFIFDFDGEAPTAVIVLDDPSPTNLDEVHFNVHFSEPLAIPLSTGDVSLAPGSLASTIGVSGVDPEYTVTATLTDPNANGTVGVEIPSGMITDAAGNPYAGNSSPLYTIEEEAPDMPAAGMAGLVLLGVAGLISGVASLRRRK